MKQTMFAKLFGIIALGLAITSNANAKEQTPTVTTGGGLTVKASDDYSFKVHGRIAADSTIVSGSTAAKGKEFVSGANLAAAISFGGDINKDLSYLLVTCAGADNKLNMANVQVTYSGFATDNLSLTVGQIDPGYSLENNRSAKWIPFLSRSMHVNAFGPGTGIGASVNKWGDNYSFLASITQAKQGSKSGYTETKEENAKSPDNLIYSGRAIFAPVMEDGKVLQTAIAGHYEKYDRDESWLRFKAKPEASARNMEAVLDTNIGTDGKTRTIRAVGQYTFGAEIAAQNGPFYGEIEYQSAHVKRNNDNPNVNFEGYHVQAAYVLTGESRAYNIKSGTFGQVKPNSGSKYGAWEVAARYSYISLNSKEIQGGIGNSITAGLNWYANDYVRVTANYIRTEQTPGATRFTADEKRLVHIFGMRGQLAF